MTENTNEKELKEKRSRYSDVAVILRQLYGVRMTGMPGYILLQDVLYKYLENKNLTIDELVEWACKHFVFTISVDDAYDEILQVVTQQLPEAENGEEDVMMLLPKVLSEATDLYEKRMLFGKITEAVHKLKISPMIKQDIISILFEIKRGKTIDQALEKLANEDVAGVTEAERLKEKAKRKKELHNIILVAFSSEVELLEIAETIE